MIDQTFLKILACPETKQPLQPAPLEVIARLNQMIEAGRLVNRSGNKVEEKLEEGLIREDGRIFYLVREGIPVLLAEESILLDAPGA